MSSQLPTTLQPPERVNPFGVHALVKKGKTDEFFSYASTVIERQSDLAICYTGSGGDGDGEGSDV